MVKWKAVRNLLDNKWWAVVDESGSVVIAECSRDKAVADFVAAAPELLEALDPDTLDAIADEIDCHQHSARAHGLRSIAARQRAAIAKATGE